MEKELEEGKRAKRQTERKYKDTLFRMIFSEKEALLSLYNAVNGTQYADPEDLEVNTLEHAVYMNMKNDISFVFDFYLNLYEHQSTFNPNMPLRNLFYVSKVLSGMTAKRNLYGSRIIQIPTPRFVVFYNGEAEKPERMVLHLSDAFEKPMEEPELELKVTVLNINAENNGELFENCRLLREYMLYVEKVRKYTAKLPIEEAVNRAVDESIQEGILEEFLRKHRAEAVEVSIFEYDEQAHMQSVREEGIAEGIKEGKAQGIAEGIIRLLEDCGEVPYDLQKRIKEEKDMEALTNWLKLAARSTTIEHFQEEM